MMRKAKLGSIGFFLILISITLCNCKPMERHLEILNDSGCKVEVYWVRPDDTGELILTMSSGANVTLDTFVNHEFWLREVPSRWKVSCCGSGGKTYDFLPSQEDDVRVRKEIELTDDMKDDLWHIVMRFPFDSWVLKGIELTDDMKDDLWDIVRHFPYESGSPNAQAAPRECRTAYMTVNGKKDQVIVVRKGMQLDYLDKKSSARDASVGICSEAAKAVVEDGNLTSEQIKEVVDDAVSCMLSSVAKRIEAAREEVAFQSQTRRKITSMLEDYRCDDSDLATTSPVEARQWTFDKNVYDVGILYEGSSSKIHLLKNFITAEECAAIDAAAAPVLHDTNVANDVGASTKQAGIRVPWQKEAEGDPIARVSRRIYGYTNNVTGYGLQVHGQEEILSIQYFGRGGEYSEPDRYWLPNQQPQPPVWKVAVDPKSGQTYYYDAATGEPSQWNRPIVMVAAMVMYCAVPESGGATNFKNAGVTVKPEVGSAAFFSYMSLPDLIAPDWIMDNQLTEHSGCPVIEGTKRIGVQWMVRTFVDSHDDPWDSISFRVGIAVGILVGALLGFFLDDLYNAVIDFLVVLRGWWTGWTPLRFACMYKAPLGVSLFLAETNPAAIESKDRLERTPLHWACRKDARLELIKILAERYPEALDMEDRWGHTPVTLVSSASPEVIAFLKTLRTLLRANPTDDEVVRMFLECRGERWSCHVAPIFLHWRNSVVQKLGIDRNLMPILLGKVSQEGRVQTMFGIVRETIQLFRVVGNPNKY